MNDYPKYGKDIMENIGKILREYQKDHDLTDVSMAVRCEISLSVYKKLKSGKGYSDRGCDNDTMYKLHKGLKIPYDEFYDIDKT